MTAQTVLRAAAGALLILAITAPAAAQEAGDPGAIAAPAPGHVAAIFALWEGEWQGSGEEMNWETGEMESVSETLSVRRRGLNGVTLIYDGDPESALDIDYADGMLVYAPGTEEEGREEITDFAPANAEGEWRIVTASQAGDEEGLFDILQVYHMGGGSFRHEIASRPVTAAEGPAGEAESLTDFSIDFQMAYRRAGG